MICLLSVVVVRIWSRRWLLELAKCWEFTAAVAGTVFLAFSCVSFHWFMI